MFGALRTRLLVGFVLIVGIAVGTVSYIATQSTKAEFGRYISRDQAERYEKLSLLLSQYFRTAEGWEGVQRVIDQIGDSYRERIVLTTPEGQVVGDSQDELRKQDIPDNWPGKIGTLKLNNQAIGKLYIRSRESTPVEKSFLSSVNRSVLLGALVAGLASIVLAFLYSKKIAGPIKSITAASRKMKEGDLQQRVEVNSKDEIGELADSFNSMVASLEKQERLRKNMVSDVSHELRGPLSNIQGYLEALQEGLLEPEPEIINSLYQESLLLGRLTDDLHDLARAEAGQLQLEKQPVVLEDIIGDAVNSVVNRTTRDQIEICSDLSSTTMVRADPNRIGEVLRNLLNNAVRHSPENETVTVSIERRAEEAVTHVIDNGEGIPSSELPHVFERFYRIDKSRNRSTGGSGLGLTIAREIVEAHDGEIWVESEVDKGSTFSFSLPLLEAKDESSTDNSQLT
ncbi:MAG: sensor histidine kinase [Candidatus Acetothermia bacterium]